MDILGQLRNITGFKWCWTSESKRQLNIGIGCRSLMDSWLWQWGLSIPPWVTPTHFKVIKQLVTGWPAFCNFGTTEHSLSTLMVPLQQFSWRGFACRVAWLHDSLGSRRENMAPVRVSASEKSTLCTVETNWTKKPTSFRVHRSRFKWLCIPLGEPQIEQFLLAW